MPTARFSPSPYQEAVFAWVRDGRGSCVVEAAAGSGKTSTLVQAAHFLPVGTRAIFLAFNRKIADELKTRLPAHVEARTMNSLGNGIVFKHAGKRPLDADKLDRVIGDVLDESGLEEVQARRFKYPLKIVVGLIRNHGIRPSELRGNLWEAAKEQVVYECDELDASLLSQRNAHGAGFFDVLRELSSRVVSASVSAPDIDFDDQIYLPIYNGWTVRPYDFVFVDEAQDLSPANRKLLRLVSNKRTRFCFIGDSRQAIYGFRGADSQSIQAIKAEFDTATLPLSICYRCPKDVVRMAQGLAPEIEWFDGNDDGIVSVDAVPFAVNLFEANDLILCRLNAPLVSATLRLAKAGKRCVMLGRDFGRSLARLVRSFKCQDIGSVPKAAHAWMTKKCDALEAVGKGQSGSMGAVVDKYEALVHFCQELHPVSVDELCTLIESRFSDEEDGKSVVLSTIHKAKGREFDRVFIMDAGRIGSFKGRGSDQEANVMYVAVTRAKRELGFVDFSQIKRPSDLFKDMIADYLSAKDAPSARGVPVPSVVEILEPVGKA